MEENKLPWYCLVLKKKKANIVKLASQPVKEKRCRGWHFKRWKYGLSDILKKTDLDGLKRVE